MTHTPQQIFDFCDSWIAAVTLPDGGVLGDDGAEMHRLLRNDIRYHNLPFESICAAIAATTKTLLRPGRNAFITDDHTHLWAWCGQVLFNYGMGQVFDVRTEYGIQKHFLLCLHTALGGPVSRQLLGDRHHHEQHVLMSSPEVLAHLSFPLLEAVTKRICAAYVSSNGTVLQPFGPYQPGTDRFGYPYTCSSLWHLLNHAVDEVITCQEVRSNALVIKNHIAEISGKQDGFRGLYDWRNESLHGTQTARTVGGTVLNLALLLTFADVAANYEQRRQDTLLFAQDWQNRPPHPDFTLYPPRP